MKFHSLEYNFWFEIAQGVADPDNKVEVGPL